MFGRVEGKAMEGWKIVIAIAAIAAGATMTSTLPPTPPAAGVSLNVVGLWSWVTEGTAEPVAPSKHLVEFRRLRDGHFIVRRVWPAGAGNRATLSLSARATVDGDYVCVGGGDGVTFRGRLSADGSRIEGRIKHPGGTIPASLRRVERRRTPVVAGAGSTT